MREARKQKSGLRGGVQGGERASVPGRPGTKGLRRGSVALSERAASSVKVIRTGGDQRQASCARIRNEGGRKRSSNECVGAWLAGNPEERASSRKECVEKV